MENTMSITISVPANADNASIAAALRMRAGQFEGLTAKEAASRKNTDGPTPEPKAEKKTKKAAAKVEEEQFDLDGEEAVDGEIVDEDPLGIGDDEPKEEAPPKHTKEDVIKALQAKVKKDGGNRDKAIAVVKKFAKSGKVTDIKPDDYAKVLKALGA